MTDISTSDWTEGDASNTSTPPNGWPAGMLGNQVEPAARAIRGALKRFYNHINATATSGGTANVQTLTYSVAPAALVAGDDFEFIVGGGLTNTGSTTLNVNALGAKTIKIGGANLSGGELQAGQVAKVAYDGTNFQLLSFASVGPTSWTPTDASGASLSLTVNTAVYYKIGKLVTVVLDVAYPSTADSSTAKIGGLPFTSYNSTSSVFGAAWSSGLANYVVPQVTKNATTIQFWDNTTTALRTNASLSTKGFQFSITYFTN